MTGGSGRRSRSKPNEARQPTAAANPVSRVRRLSGRPRRLSLPLDGLRSLTTLEQLKTELPIEVYGDVRAAREEIRAYLCYYDTKRRHSSLNYLTPCEFELCQE